MPEPNATPAPLTMTPEQEAECRAIVADAATWAEDMDHKQTRRIAADAFALLDATRAKLAEAEALRATSEAQLASLSPKLADAESRVAALTVAGGAALVLLNSHPAYQNSITANALRAALSPSQDVT